MIREIGAGEARRLRPFLDALAAYHNEVSLHHKGMYPAKDMDMVIQQFQKDIEDGTGAVAVSEMDGAWQGFASVTAAGGVGSIGFLFVSEAARGKGLGRVLMDWAMAWLDRAHVERIEVKVIAGNPAIHLYEAYGFQLNAHILWK